MIPVKRLTFKNFEQYGKILDFESDGDQYKIEGGQSEWNVVFDYDKPVGWRIGIYKGRDHEITKLECHPSLWETFEPVSGIGILLVAPHEQPESLEAFLLDRPVVAKPKIWHWILALSDIAKVKVTEDHIVDKEYHHLKRPLSVFLSETA